MAGGFDAVTRANTIMADKIVANADRFKVSTGIMGDAAEEASATIVAGSTEASRRLGMVTAAANRASTAMTRYRGASAGGGSGIPTPPGFRGGQGGGGSGAAAAAGAAELGPGGVAGIAALLAMSSGVQQAAKLQDATVQTAVAMGKPSAWAQANLTGTAMKMSMSTAQSVADSMSLLQVMATSGFNNEADLKTLGPTIAKFADTQFLGKHNVPFDDSAAMAVKIAHQFGARTPGQLSPILNTLWKMSQDMPDTLQTAATQLKYYDANYTNSGVSATETLMLQAAADRMGYGSGRSGSGFNQILRTMQSPSLRELAAQRALGEIGPDGRNRFLAGGVFNVEGLLNSLNAQENAARAKGGNAVTDFNTLLQNASSSNGSTILSAMSSNAGRGQYAAVMATMKRVQDLQAAQAQLMGTLSNRTKQMTSNIQTLLATIAGPLIPALTGLVTAIGTAAGNASMFLAGRPALAGGLAIGGTALGAYGAVSGARWAAGNLLGGHGARAVAAARVGRSALSIGGLAEGALDILSFAPMFRMLRGGVGMARGLGIGSRIAGDLGPLAKAGLSAMPWIGDAAKAFARLGGPLKFVGGLASGIGRVALPFLGEGILKLGLKAIPVVGNILMLIDTLKFLGSHSRDIGFMVGEAVKWIQTTGGPMLRDTIIGMIKGVASFAWQSITGMFSHKGGIWDVVNNFQHGYSDAMDPNRNSVLTSQTVGLPGVGGGGGGGPILVNHGTINVHANNPRDFMQQLHQGNAEYISSAGGLSNIGPQFPAALMLGIGTGRQ
jgi:hypothetical protein